MRSKWLLAAAVACVGGAAVAQPPGGGKGFGGGPGGGPAGLLLSKTVRDDLKVTDDQAAKLKTWQAEFGPKMREMMQEKLKDIPRDEMREKFPEVQAEMAKVTYKELAGVLKSDQVKRLKQIDVQVAGLRAFAVPETAAALKVTDDQKEKLKTVIDESQKDMRDLGEEYGARFPGQRPTDPDKAKEFDQKAAQINKEAMTKVMAMMTADQKAAFKELQGAPIDVAKVRAESMGGGQRKKKTPAE